MTAPIPDNEADRLAELRNCHILDTPATEAFDDLTHLAAQICGVPIAAVSLIDEYRQWFKSILGLAVSETPRDAAFCAHTILQPDVMVVPDAAADARFSSNPLVTGDPNIRFYAGAPLVTSDGHALGSLCVIDIVPRQLTPAQALALQMLARQATSQIELTRRIAIQERLMAERRRIDNTLQAERRFQNALLESLQEGIVACDAAGTLTLFNNTMREFHGLPEQLLPVDQWARHFDLYQSDGMTPMQAQDVPLFRALQGEVVRGAEIVIKPKCGPNRSLLASGQAIYGSEGEKLGAVIALHDVTTQAAATRAIRQSEERLNEAQAIAQIGSWEYEIAIGCIHWSDELFRLFGMDPAEGEPSVEELMQQYHPDDVAMHREISTRAMQDGLPYEFDIRIVRRDGAIRWAHAVGRGERNANGEVGRLVGTLMDIHERKSMEEALRDSKQFIESITDHSTSIIFVFDMDTMTNVYSNRNVGEFLGYSTQQVQDMGDELLPLMLHPDDLPHVLSHFSQFADKADGEVVEIEYRARHVSGEWRWIWNREVVFKRHSNGAPWQIMGTANDITERKQAQEESVRLAAIVESSHDAVLGATLDGTLVSWNAAAEQLYGYTEAEIIGQHASVLAPPSERGFIAEVTQAVLRGERRENIEVKRRRKDGKEIDLSLTFSPIRNTAGEIIGIAAIGRDITAQQQAKEALRRSQEAFRTVMEGAPIVFYATDREGIVTFSEGAGLERLGLAPGQVVGQSVFEMYRDVPDIAGNLRRALGGETVSYDAEVGGLCYHNEVRPQRNQDGAITGLIGVGHDITERKQAEEALKDFAVVLEFQKQELERANAELAALATIDGLTGMRNRRAFDERLSEEFERASRYHTPLSLLLLDIDHFKQYNDAFGHPAGDEVLRMIGRVLQKATRETDFLARYGGEEIAVILPETDGDGAMQVAERIRLAVATTAWECREVTASLGVCSLKMGMERPEEMIKCADRALYQSKAGGRNRVTHGQMVCPESSDGNPDYAAPLARAEAAPATSHSRAQRMKILG